MARLPRYSAFLLDVDRFFGDPVVIAMRPRARAYYMLLLAALWKAPEPGVIPDSDRVLEGLIQAGEDFAEIREEIRSAFDAESRPGHLVQHGVVRTHQQQTQRVDMLRTYGQLGGRAAARKRKSATIKPLSQAIAKLQPSYSHPRQGVGSGSVVREEESTPSRGAESTALVSEFDHLWAAFPHYGRRSSKHRSRARYLALRPRPLFADVLAGLKACAASEDWRRDGGRYVPAMEVWIARHGWDSSTATAPPSTDADKPYRHPLTDQLEQWEREHPE